MNKQLLNKVLIVALLLIWSIVGYKLISSFFGKTQVIGENQFLATNNLEKKTEKKDSFELPSIIRDPFLGSYSVPKKEIRSEKLTTQRSSKRTKEIWPQIEYYGFVRGENSKNPLVMLKINNNLQRIRKGSHIEGLHVKEVYRDSILIVFGNAKKIIVKK